MTILLPLLLLLAALRVVFHFFIRRIGLLLLWLLALLGLLLIVLPALHVHAQTPVLSPRQLIAPVAAHFEHQPHGAFRVVRVTLHLPPVLPPHAEVVLAGDATGTRPFIVDDLVRLAISTAHQPPITITINCDRPDGRGVVPHDPVDLTQVIGRGTVRLAVTLIDTRPPQFYSSALWLVVRVPTSVAHLAATSAAEGNTGIPSRLPLRLLALAGLLVATVSASLLWVRLRGTAALSEQLLMRIGQD